MGKIKKDDKQVNFRDPLFILGLIVDQVAMGLYTCYIGVY